MNSAIQEVRPDEALAIMQQDPHAVLLDVRSTMEYEYVGHPVGALHVPLMEPPAWEPDPAFVDKVHRALQSWQSEPMTSATILTLCRSGKRSQMAAELLATSGFKRLYNIAEGFEGDRNDNKHRSSINGWRYRGLPWEQG
jgi:rhodanese-related sulfurtransferase